MDLNMLGVIVLVCKDYQVFFFWRYRLVLNFIPILYIPFPLPNHIYYNSTIIFSKPLTQPWAWNTSRIIVINSQSALFHPDLPGNFHVCSDSAANPRIVFPGGDPRNEFFIGRDLGNVLLARKLDHEVQDRYTLNISVSDSVSTVYEQLNVTVIDINDHRPVFSENLYQVDISEAVPPGTEILRLKAGDADAGSKLIYSLYSARNGISWQTFKIDSISGVIYLSSNLDRWVVCFSLRKSAFLCSYVLKDDCYGPDF